MQVTVAIAVEALLPALAHEPSVMMSLALGPSGDLINVLLLGWKNSGDFIETLQQPIDRGAMCLNHFWP